MDVIAERNLRAVDLNLLVVFDALMAERNVTRAAERNGLSQPAVSKALNRLRFMFADQLFVRRDRSMEPTPRALELAGPIHGALADISLTLTLPSVFEPSAARGTVKIATIDLYHTKLLPSLVQYLRQHAPGVDLQVRANDCSHIYEQLAAEEIDIAFAPCPARFAVQQRDIPDAVDQAAAGIVGQQLREIGKHLRCRITLHGGKVAVAPCGLDAGEDLAESVVILLA